MFDTVKTNESSWTRHDFISAFFFVTEHVVNPPGTRFSDLNICTRFTPLYFHTLLVPRRLPCSCFLFLWGLTGQWVSLLLIERKRQERKIYSHPEQRRRKLGLLFWLIQPDFWNIVQWPINITIWSHFMETSIICSLLPLFHSHLQTGIDVDWERCIEVSLAWPGWCVDVKGASKCSWMILMNVANGDIKRKWVHFSL